MKGSIVGLIPVKGSSERVPNKNLREFNTAKFENIGDKKQKAIKEIEKLINSIDNLG